MIRNPVISTLAVLIVAGGALVASAHGAPLTRIARYETGIFDESAAEIPAYDPIQQHLFVVNAEVGVDIFDMSDIGSGNMPHIGQLATPGTNSVAVHDGLIALAVANDVETSPGTIQLYRMVNGQPVFQGAAGTGALPDMLTFTPDGSRLLVANEGEPDDGIDPVGSISVVDVTNPAAPAVQIAGFEAFNSQIAQLQADNVHLFPEALDGTISVAQDLEPEYITISGDKAYVGLQEANALAVVDIPSATVEAIKGLGYKNHALEGNELDASDKDGGVNIREWPIFGMYQPDAIASYQLDGKTYIVTANEGDARDDYEERVEDLDLDPGVFPNADWLQEKENLGRLEVNADMGDLDDDGQYERIVSYGARSFSIFTEQDGKMQLVFDTGSEFEQILAAEYPDDFNNDNDENDPDSRSDAKGPEPEGVTLGEIDGSIYAFVGLERMGGFMIYDVTDPADPSFIEYINPRDFDGDPEAGTADDLGPEGLVFISATDSPTGNPLLVVANEVSGSTSVYSIDTNTIPEPTVLALLGLGSLAALRRRRRG